MDGIMSKASQQAFTDKYNGQGNFMTPTVISYHDNGQIAPDTMIELSSGSGMTGNTIFGVTVLKRGINGIDNDHDSSKMFHDRSEALEYIEELNG